MPLEVDVVIPTFRRPEALTRCLAALERQTVAPASIEVVDDSETDYGPGIARNTGWRRGAAEIVAFIDDDCIASENWIEVILSIFEDGGVGGIEGAMTTLDDSGNLVPYNPPNRFRWDRFKTANLIIKRSALEEVGGFDERYYLHREDTDLAWRVIDTGYRIIWSSDCIVHHPEPVGTHGGVYGGYPRSEQLLYHCNRGKYVESAAGLISRTSVMDGTLRKLQRDLRSVQEPSDVKPLSRLQSWALWSKAWGLAIFWVIRKNTMGEPRGAKHNLR